jgi:hypothetical protein
VRETNFHRRSRRDARQLDWKNCCACKKFRTALAGSPGIDFAAQSNRSARPPPAFNACTILFCAAPLGLLGAVTDGLSGYFYLLAVKAVMDGLAMTAL